MPVHYWLLLAAVLALLCGQRLLRRVLLRALMGRTRCWRLRPVSDGSLRARGCRLRLYGIGNQVDVEQVVVCLKALMDAQPLRWRVLSIDRDGTLAIVLRANGGNVAVDLLRLGAVAVRGTGARRYRAAQAQAHRERMGLWQHGEGWSATPREDFRRLFLSFPWWQG